MTFAPTFERPVFIPGRIVRIEVRLVDMPEVWLSVSETEPRQPRCGGGTAAWRRGRWDVLSGTASFDPATVLHEALTAGTWEGPPLHRDAEFLKVLRAVCANPS